MINNANNVEASFSAIKKETFMKVFNLFGKIVATVFAFLTLGLGLLTLANHTSAQAEVKYLTVKQSDFTVESFGKIGNYYQIACEWGKVQ